VSPADLTRVVTIDGPAASGKSSTARMVAEALGIRHGDSGAFYRAATAARLRLGGATDEWTERSVLEAAAAIDAVPGPDTTFEVRIGGVPAEAELRGEAVTATVSLVAKMPHVRAWVNQRMRALAEHGPIVVDGRDMGTTVFPEARVKVWLVAHAGERARRRIRQRTGREATPEELDAETHELEARDFKDQEQTRPAPEAVWIDTSDITQADQVAQIVALVRG
jgi:cytidylate kinase